MSAPLYERLRAYSKKRRVSFAMPGHKNGRGIKKSLISLDVTELDETENLHNPHEYVKKAQELLSGLYRSEKSYILTSGSTAAIQSMICGAVKKGGTLLAGSDCHMSVINTCALLGIKIRFVNNSIDDEFLIPRGIKSVKEYLTEEVCAVIITSPNYYGLCSDIANIARECHEKNIPLLVDEAHGAHFAAADCFPETAVHFADAVCQSAHKTLNALNGAAYLHVNGTLINRERLEKSLSMFQSSSPSYVIAASADTAREELSKKNAWKRTCDLCLKLKSEILRLGIRTLDNDDITRLVLNFSEFNTTGIEICKMLSDMGIDAEMADMLNVVLIITPSNRESDFRKLLKALKKLTAGLEKRTERIAAEPPPITYETLSPSDAFFADSRVTELKNSAGKVSRVSVVPYPPGIPVIHMGEMISREQTEYIDKLINSGAEITGLTNNNEITVAEFGNE